MFCKIELTNMIALILKISRPRFWLYLAGTYFIGVAFTTNLIEVFSSFRFLYPFFYFLIPANIILYGINDLADGDTDTLNKKKRHRELRAKEDTRGLYKKAILVSFILAIPLLFIFPLFASILLGIFFLLSYAYSGTPLRLKSKPFVDSASNILYAFPAFIGMYQFSGTVIPLPLLLAVFCWTAAMHLFSAIPDIEPDTKARLRTSAVVLGLRWSLFICALLWAVTAGIAVFYSIFLFPLFIYSGICFYLLRQKASTVETVYWMFPWINALVGFGLFVLSVFAR